MSQAERKALADAIMAQAREGEVGSPSNPVPTKRKVGGFKPSKVPKSYISRALKDLSGVGKEES